MREALTKLVKRAEHFVDEVERQRRTLDVEERERLAGLLVHLGAGRIDEAADEMRRLDVLLAAHVRMRGTREASCAPTFDDYRALLKVVLNNR